MVGSAVVHLGGPGSQRMPPSASCDSLDSLLLQPELRAQHQQLQSVANKQPSPLTCPAQPGGPAAP